MGVNSLPKTGIRQRHDCDLNLGPSAPESSTLTTRLSSHPKGTYTLICGNLLSLRLKQCCYAWVLFPFICCCYHIVQWIRLSFIYSMHKPYTKWHTSNWRVWSFFNFINSSFSASPYHYHKVIIIIIIIPIYGPFSGTTQVSRYQKGKTNLDFTEYEIRDAILTCARKPT